MRNLDSLRAQARAFDAKQQAEGLPRQMTLCAEPRPAEVATEPEMSPCYRPWPGGVPIMAMAADAASMPQLQHRESERIAIDILGRIMGRCQGGWYWANVLDLKDWYCRGEWKIRELHDGICHEYYSEVR